MLQRHLTIIRNRWPRVAHTLEKAPPCGFQETCDTKVATLVIDGLHLGSAYNPRAEAEIQADLIPPECPTAWIYGLGNGELPTTLLQQHKMLHTLHVIIMNPAVALASLSFFNHDYWLRDPRIQLSIAADQQAQTPLVAIPPCLELASEESARLRDLVALELESPFLRQQHSTLNPEVRDRIASNKKFVEIDGDVQSLFKTRPQGRVIIAGAGPSLGLNIEQLRTERKSATLIAVNSSLKPLMLAGITPDIVVTIDDNPKILSCFQGFDLKPLKSIPLVYFPRVPQTVLRVWPGPRLAAYTEHSSYTDIAQQLPRGKLFSSGSVLHSAVDLAVQMGAAEIILFGADLAFPGGQKYTPGAGWQELEISRRRQWVLDGQGQKVETIPCFRGYLRDLEDYIARQTEVLFYNCSLQGAHIRGTQLWQKEPG
ncbi:MAG: DUF115 domain-containing protein [Geopsychrobacter sp.]|nr:DUF115 domain-containing protein [Geopsychrobacter sp.]